MSKKYKRITGLVMAFVMAFLSFAPFAVSAVEVVGEDTTALGIIGSSGSALYSISGAQASASLCKSLEKYSVNVDDDTLIEVVPVAAGSDSTALLVTNVEGETIQQSYFVAVGEDLQIKSSSLPGNDRISVRGGDFISETLDNSLIIQMFVEYNSCNYNGFVDYLIQPETVMFVYYDDDNQYDVTLAQLYYECNGYEYSYDHNDSDEDGIIYENIQGTGRFVEHSIPLQKSNPNPRTYYSATDPYTNKLINAYNYFYETHYVSYYFEINRADGRSGNLQNIWVIGID